MRRGARVWTCQTWGHWRQGRGQRAAACYISTTCAPLPRLLPVLLPLLMMMGRGGRRRRGKAARQEQQQPAARARSCERARLHLPPRPAPLHPPTLTPLSPTPPSFL